MSNRYQIPSGWNLPPGVTDRMIDELSGGEAAEGDFDPCVFCQSTAHDPSDCPDADESINEDLWGD